MKSNRRLSISLAILAISILCACPKYAPKYGERNDTRLQPNDAYLQLERDAARDDWQKPDQVLDLAEIAEGDKVGVAYAGVGYFVSKLSAAVGATGVVYATDPDDKMIEGLNKLVTDGSLSNVKITKARNDDPAFPYGKLDVAFVVDAQNYIDLPYAFFDNLRRSMKSGGKIVVIDWHKDSQKGPDKKFRRSENDMVKILKGMGFEPVLKSDDLKYQYFLIYKSIHRYGKLDGIWDI